MKKIISIGALVFLSISSVFAEYSDSDKANLQSSSKITYDNSINFEIDRQDSKVTASWNKYSGSDFKYYKLVKSYAHDNPVYPKDQTVFVGMTAQENQNSFEDWTKVYGYYRVCIVKTDESIVCSNVEKLEAFENDEKPVEYCIDVIQPAYHPVTWECRDFSTPCEVKTGWKKVSSCNAKEVINKQEEYNGRKNASETKDETQEYQIDRVMKQRADAVINKLVNNLDNQDISQDKKIEKLDILIQRLAQLEVKLKTSQALSLVSYLKDQLEAKKEMFEKYDDIESIFSILED